jgi:hypothetical protein
MPTHMNNNYSIIIHEIIYSSKSDEVLTEDFGINIIFIKLVRYYLQRSISVGKQGERIFRALFGGLFVPGFRWDIAKDDYREAVRRGCRKVSENQRIIYFGEDVNIIIKCKNSWELEVDDERYDSEDEEFSKSDYDYSKDYHS